ncbi:MAG: hypothetical protein PHH26_07245 [Candidatus Thermoplasmatota archaeon]|nr:hypothetical protein [Candidatus Thermoplasmatota archaeon]
MNINRRTVFAFALATLGTALHTAPANAMGHSGVPASMAGASAQATEHQSPTQTEMQTQIDALRKEMTEIKAQMSMAKVAADTTR